MRDLLPVDETQKHKLPDKFDKEHCGEARDLVLLMTSFDPMKRPSAKEILEGKLKSYIKKVKERTKRNRNRRRLKMTVTSDFLA